MLSDSESSESGDDAQQLLTINEHFAKAYQLKKEREELTKLQEKYGSDVDENELEADDSEDDTTEDEDGEELTPALDAAILRTLARIKRKDPEIYDGQKDVFEEEQRRSKNTFSFKSKKAEDKRKPLHMRQHILQSQLNGTSRSPSPEPQPPTHAQEQAALRKEVISAFHGAVEAKSDEEDEDGILVPREKNEGELERELEDYRTFLENEVGEELEGLVEIEKNDIREESDSGAVQAGSESGDPKKRKKRKERKKSGKSKEDEDHEFLMNYILNRGWVDKSSQRVPTFKEVTSGVTDGAEDAAENEGDGGAEDEPLDELDEEDEFDDVADTFESSYNFRFEEPDAAQIPAYPRTIQSTVRREENPRKAARERKKQRKEEGLLQRREEVKRLKSLKMKEIREKLERIGKEGGKDAEDEALAQLDLDADWDPDVHDKQMEGIYGNGKEDELETDDMDKPTWDDDIDITDILPAEAEAGPSSSSSSSKKKKKKKGKLENNEDDGVDVDEMDAEAPLPRKPVDKKKMDEAMDEVYGLEFNDIVGGVATRFKYVPVLPQSYSMSATDILLADDADLNDVVGLRKLAPYRRDKGRIWDTKRGEKLNELRKKVSGNIGAQSMTSGHNDSKPKPRKGKKERQKAKAAAEEQAQTEAAGGGTENEVSVVNRDDDSVGPPKRKRRRKSKQSDIHD